MVQTTKPETLESAVEQDSKYLSSMNRLIVGSTAIGILVSDAHLYTSGPDVSNVEYLVGTVFGACVGYLAAAIPIICNAALGSMEK